MVSSSDDVLDVIREQRRAYEPFTPLTDDEVKRAVQAIQNAIGEWGSDRLHAQWARHVLENTERNVLATVGAGDRHVTKMCQYCGRDYYDLASHLSERHGIDMPSVGDRPPAPSDQETGEPQDLFDAINLLLWHEARAAKNRDGNVASALIANRDEARRRLVALYRGAVRPPPRAALTVERLAALLWKMANEGPGVGSHIEMAEWLLPRLGAASPAAAPREEGT